MVLSSSLFALIRAKLLIILIILYTIYAPVSMFNPCEEEEGEGACLPLKIESYILSLCGNLDKHSIFGKEIKREPRDS